MFQISIWSTPPLLAALVCVGAYFRLLKKRRVPGIYAVLALLAAVLFWSATDFLGTLVTDLGLKQVIGRFSYLGVVLVPVTWFAFAVSYTRRQMRLPPIMLNVICVIPLLTIGLVMSNDWHGLIWASSWLIEANGYIGLINEPGPWFYAYGIYAYLLIVIGTTILAWSISQTTGELKPVLAVVFTPLVVCVANLFSFSPINPSPWFDTTMLGFVIAAMILDGGLLRYGVLDTIPVVRDSVVEQLSDGVVVINCEGMIIDINPSALEVFGTSRAKVSNKSITHYVKTVPLETLLAKRRQNLEVSKDDMAFEISISSLDASSPEADVVLVFRDVTARRKAEQDLRQVQDELVRLAHTDYLTGLHNRRFFMQRLEEECERVRRHGSNLSVLLFDLDHFKLVNDTCGHDLGDRVLKRVAKVTMDVKRITDVAARIGGEEFALLLPETDQRGAVQLAQRLRESVAELEIKELEEAVDDGGQRPRVTTSVGVATVGVSSDDIDNVLNYADEALYKAKNSGRNAVCCAEITGKPKPRRVVG
jgi:diguanylate cyclase (GGDEF)-like protein/PAS domain S-box-containing protein